MIKFLDWNKRFAKHIESLELKKNSINLILPNDNCIKQLPKELKNSNIKTLNELSLENIKSKKLSANSFVKIHHWKSVLKEQSEPEFKKNINANFEINTSNLNNFSNYCYSITSYINKNLISYEDIIQSYKTNKIPKLKKWVFLKKLHSIYIKSLDKNGYMDLEFELSKLENPVSKNLNLKIYGCQFLNPLEISFLDKLKEKNELEFGIYCNEKHKEGFNEYGNINISYWEKLEAKSNLENIIFTENTNEEIGECIKNINTTKNKNSNTDIIPLSSEYVSRLNLELKYSDIEYYSFWSENISSNKLLNFIVDLIDYELENSSYNFIQLVKNVLFRKISTINFEELNKYLEFKIPKNIDIELAGKFIDSSSIIEITESLKNDSIDIAINKLSKISKTDLNEKDLKILEITKNQLDKITFENKLLAIHEVISNSKFSKPYKQSKLNILSFRDSIYNNSQQRLLLGFNKNNFPKIEPALLHKTVLMEQGIKDYSQAQASYFYNFLENTDHKIFIPKIDINEEKAFPSNFIFKESANKSANIIKKFYSAKKIKKKITANNSLKVGFPKPVKTDIENISISSIRDYLICPYLFYLKHILKLSSPYYPVMEMNARVFGTLAHLVLQNFGNKDSIQDFKKCFDSIVQQYFQNNISSIVKLQLFQLENRISGIVNLQRKLNQEKWEIYESECSVSEKHNQISLRGRIDRIDINKDSKKIRIIDFKTSDKKISLKKVLDIESCIDFQLPIYANTVKNKLKSKFPDYSIEVGYVSFPKELTESKLEFTELTSEELFTYKSEYDQIINSISEQKFWPPRFENWSNKEKLYFVYENES